ncbi:MAG: flagellar hook basal-body protein [Bryobacteraceae bacterium]|nr:flagellar hook basal-body protein [Bryobacteraceae bacterium]
MDALTMAAASGLRARIESLDLLANNLANATTAGFKADRESYSTYFSQDALEGPAGSLPVAAPVVENNWTDHGQGVLTATGNPLDFALAGPGFFVVEGPGGGPLYTRNGNFLISREGYLVNQEGQRVRNGEGKPIQLDPYLPVESDSQGTLRQAGRVAGKLAVVDIKNRQELKKAGSTYFSYETPAGGLPAAAAKVEQGRLEAANFHPAEAAVRLVGVMRQFEMLNRALSLGGEMNRKTIDEVARVRE